MPIGVNLLLDSATAAKITSLLPDRQRASYPPHSRLATYGDDLDEMALSAGLAIITETWSPICLGLVGYGVFPGDPNILWALPAPIHALLGRHHMLDAGLLAVTGRHSFEYGGWLPDIALGITQFPGDAIEVLASAWRGPIEGTMTEIEVVRYERHKPVQALYRRNLEW